MKTEETNQNQEAIYSSNKNYVNNAPFMMMRIDTASLIKKINLFLSSQQITYKFNEKTQNWEEKIQTLGLPLASPEGIMRICNIVEMRINHHVAQGNFDKEHYWDFIARARKEITETIVKKCYDWRILDSNLNMIIDEISALIEAYLTRPIENKERDSYGQQFQSKENTVLQQPRSFAQNFGGGFRQ